MTKSETTPLVSIGMPVYNGERFIRKALDSLLAQDYGNFEIISDNTIIDKTEKIYKKYKKLIKFNKIKAITMRTL